MLIRYLLPVAALCCLTTLPSLASAQIAVGLEPYDEALVAARFRSFGNTGGGEIYVGVGDLGASANRQEINRTWTDGDFPFTFTLDRVADELRVDVDGQTLTFPNFSAEIASKTSGNYTYDDLNILQIDVAQRDAGSTVQIIGLTQNGQLLGDFIPDANGFFTWTSQGGCVVLPDEGTLSGVLRIAGPFGNSQELSRVQLTAGVRESDGLDCATAPAPPADDPTAISDGSSTSAQSVPLLSQFHLIWLVLITALLIGRAR
ncbi:MAG: hypothetical protein AAGI11_06310 [Pseudomonadota bacterium]